MVENKLPHLINSNNNAATTNSINNSVDTTTSNNNNKNLITTNGKKYKSILKKQVNFDPNVREIEVMRETSAQQHDGRRSGSPLKLDPYATVNTLQFENKTDNDLIDLAGKYLKVPTSPSPVSQSPSVIVYKNRHWLTYPQEDQPQYIIDAKKRLGQVHPRTPPNLKERIKSDNNNNNEQNNHHEHSNAHENVEDTQAIAKRLAKHFLTYDHPDTPEHIRDIRKKYRDERYKKDFVPINYRSANVTNNNNTDKSNRYVYSSMRQEEFRKYLQAVTAVPVNNIPTPNLTLQPSNSLSLKRSKSAVAFRQNANQGPTYVEMSKPEKENEPSTSSLAAIMQILDAKNAQDNKNPNQEQVVVTTTEDIEQRSDDEGRPLTAQAKEWIDTEWDKYYGYVSKSRLSNEHGNDCETTSQDNVQIEKRPSTVIGLQSRKASNSLNEKKADTAEPKTFEEWVNIANEKDKQAVLKMLQSIDGTNPNKRPSSVQPQTQKDQRYNMNSVTYGMRTRPPSTPPRKLGKTRGYHKFPCDICEKAQIKKHIWEINNEKNNEEGYSNITGFFHNVMPTWRGQYVIHPDFSSEIKDLKRIFAVKRAKSSLK